MAYFRIFYATTAGIGCLCGSSIDKWGKDTFKVKAQVLDPERTPGSDHLASRFAKYGLPQRDVILRYRHFQMSYDQRNRMPNWVLEHLNCVKLHTPDDCVMSKRDSNYHLDPRVKNEFHSDAIDYQTGVDRINLADYSNYANTSKGLIDVHTRTNSAPQILHFNMGVWGDLVAYCRYLTYIYPDVYVFSGPLFEPRCADQMLYQVSQTNHLAYPTNYYKIIIGKTGDDFHLGCYLLPHRHGQNQELSEFRVELSVIENLTGFKLFKDGVNLPETLVNIEDFRQNKQVYMPNEMFLDVELLPGPMAVGGDGDQNGHQNGHGQNN